MTEEEYLKERVDGQIQWYGQKSAINKKLHIWSNGLIIFFGAMIPFAVATLEKAQEANHIAAGLGVLTVFFTGISSLLKFNEKWANYRITAETLKREKILYQTLCGPYEKGSTSFRVFVQNIEYILTGENKNWGQIVVSSQTIEQESES
ncbi:DUF4231 domain-containing protein [Maribacter sp. CXY002]|uniref:DUF4231 domain-containing protein n=1 Tax=Maribacter luteocoastalis TaxID=3407671 RepID=UPI003B6855BA